MNDILELESQKHIDVFYGDEAGFSLNCVIPYCWQFPNEQVSILPQKGKTINVLGFMNANGKELITFDKEGAIDAEFVIGSVDKFFTRLNKLTILILDNARIHHSLLFQSKIEEWQNKGLYIFYLPAYSPHLNRIETLWRQVKYRWIKPTDYQDLTTLSKALDSIWNSFGKNYQINFSKNKI